MIENSVELDEIQCCYNMIVSDVRYALEHPIHPKKAECMACYRPMEMDDSYCSRCYTLWDKYHLYGWRNEIRGSGANFLEKEETQKRLKAFTIEQFKIELMLEKISGEF
jgi:predicted nucleic acid-binding Zn ribbon protein